MSRKEKFKRATNKAADDLMVQLGLREPPNADGLQYQLDADGVLLLRKRDRSFNLDEAKDSPFKAILQEPREVWEQHFDAAAAHVALVEAYRAVVEDGARPALARPGTMAEVFAEETEQWERVVAYAHDARRFLEEEAAREAQREAAMEARAKARAKTAGTSVLDKLASEAINNAKLRHLQVAVKLNPHQHRVKHYPRKLMNAGLLLVTDENPLTTEEEYMQKRLQILEQRAREKAEDDVLWEEVKANHQSVSLPGILMTRARRNEEKRALKVEFTRLKRARLKERKREEAEKEMKRKLHEERRLKAEAEGEAKRKAAAAEREHLLELERIAARIDEDQKKAERNRLKQTQRLERRAAAAEGAKRFALVQQEQRRAAGRRLLTRKEMEALEYAERARLFAEIKAEQDISNEQHDQEREQRLAEIRDLKKGEALGDVKDRHAADKEGFLRTHHAHDHAAFGAAAGAEKLGAAARLFFNARQELPCAHLYARVLLPCCCLTTPLVPAPQWGGPPSLPG